MASTACSAGSPWASPSVGITPLTRDSPLLMGGKIL
jgi:hypothetical protein